MVAIVTGTISPSEQMGQLVLKNTEERLKQYVDALDFLIREKAFDKIIFCDNSGYAMEQLGFLEETALTNGTELELLSYRGNTQKCIQHGKGYGEGENLEYIFSHSKLLQGEDFFVKLTGRLHVVNIRDICRRLRTDRVYFNIPNRTIREYYDTKIYAMPVECFRNHFLPAYHQVRDEEGIYLEKVYTWIILENGIKVYNFPRIPRVIGMAGSSGLTYTYSEWKSKIRDAIGLFGGYHVNPKKANEACMEKKRLRIVQFNSNIRSTSVPYRLQKAFEAYQKDTVQSHILTMDSGVTDHCIVQIRQCFGFKVLRKIDTIFLQLEESMRYRLQKDMPISFYRVGVRTEKHPLVKNADVILLHWIAGTFLSASGIKKLLKLGKPVILVCHDNWHFTGGCHVRMGCNRYRNGCGDCPQMHAGNRVSRRNPFTAFPDWSERLCARKRKLYQDENVALISPSKWMDENVVSSIVFAGKNHKVIPNPIDTRLFGPVEQCEARRQLDLPEDALVLAYGAVNSVTSPYKGYHQLIEALQVFSELKQVNRYEKTVLLVFGSRERKIVDEGNYEIRYLGYLQEQELATMYSATDVYLVPSLEDSFNNTVAECLACETPVAAFATGGIVDIIDHQRNGYLASYNEPKDLAAGIVWILEHNKDNCLGKAGREKVIRCFSYEVIAQAYYSFLQQVTEKNG